MRMILLYIIPVMRMLCMTLHAHDDTHVQVHTVDKTVLRFKNIADDIDIFMFLLISISLFSSLLT